jgi:hypothetical protein
MHLKNPTPIIRRFEVRSASTTLMTGLRSEDTAIHHGREAARGGAGVRVFCVEREGGVTRERLVAAL